MTNNLNGRDPVSGDWSDLAKEGMMYHFNKLTPAEAERLAMLSEECGEVIQTIGKILRHGYDSYHPNQQATPPNLRYTNRQALAHELCDLFSVADIIHASDRVPLPDTQAMERAWGEKLRYAHHQRDETAIMGGE